MTGRREQQKNARKRRIVDAASHLFATRGYEATAIGDIAQRACLAVGTLYNYFPSKPDIALSIVRVKTSDALGDGEEIVKRPPADPVTAVAALMNLYVDTFSCVERDLWREIAAGAMTDPSGLGVAFFAQDVRLIHQLNALLDELRSRGDLGADADSGRGAITLYSVYVSWFMAYLANDAIGLEELREQVRQGIEVVLHGLLHDSPRVKADSKSEDTR
jgi:AcrR family transcriptional regulator